MEQQKHDTDDLIATELGLALDALDELQRQLVECIRLDPVVFTDHELMELAGKHASCIRELRIFLHGVALRKAQDQPRMEPGMLIDVG